MKFYDENVWRLEAEQLLRAAQGCNDPNLRDQLVSMAHEYLERLGRREEDGAVTPEGVVLH